MPRSMHLHTEISLNLKVYLNYSKCTWKVSIIFILAPLDNWNQTLGYLCLYAASHQCLWDIAAAWSAVVFFSRNNRFAEMHSHLQPSFHITDHLLAAENYKIAYLLLGNLDLIINDVSQLNSLWFGIKEWICFLLQDMGVLLWDNAIKRVMVVTKGGHDDVKRYWKRQRQSNSWEVKTWNPLFSLSPTHCIFISFSTITHVQQEV